MAEIERQILGAKAAAGKGAGAQGAAVCPQGVAAKGATVGGKGAAMA